MTNLSTQLRHAREKRGMTVEQVAKAVGCSEATVWIMEKDGYLPRLDFLFDYLKVLNCYCIINGPDGAFVVRERQEVRR